MGQRIGSMIGAIGGLVFVLVNAGPLGTALSLVLRVLGGLVFVATVWFAVIRSRTVDSGPPPRSAMREYAISVVAELVAIVVGAQILVRVLHRPELSLVWVVFVVGVHFIPFSRAFGLARFAVLGVALMVMALIGGLITVLVTPLGSPWTGVVAGLVLLGFAIGAAALRPAPITEHGSPGTR